MRRISVKSTSVLLMFLTVITLTLAASDPSPADGAVGVLADTALSWTGESGVVYYYKVYFGTDPSPEYKENVTETTYQPTTLLDYNTTYYWRIDALTDSGPATGTVWSFTTSSTPASKPSPADEAIDIPVDTVLSWTAASGTNYHEVYFGTNPTPGPGEYKDSTTNTTYDPGILLNYNTTYYWRIDEVKDSGTVTGTIWSFTTVTGVARGPSPANDAVDLVIDPVLSWAAGEDADSHDVYFGTDESIIANIQKPLGDINGNGQVDIDDLLLLAGQWLINPGSIPNSADIVFNNLVDLADFGALATDWNLPIDAAFKGNQSGTTFDPGTLDPSTTYYWRIDEVNASNIITGAVWSFTTRPIQAFNPSPADGASLTPLTTDLSWMPGAGAYYHKLYFGTNPTPGSNEYKGNFTNVLTYDPGVLAYNTTYYWRVDEVNAGGATTGDVWSFSIGDRLRPEDFPILPWSAPYIGHAGYSDIYACGFNLSHFALQGSELDSAANNNLKAILNGSLNMNAGLSLTQTSAEARTLTSLYKNHPGLFGYYLMDEPGADMFGTLGNYITAFRTQDPDHIAYINLFPNYASAGDENSQLQVPTYQQYVDSYLSTVQPDFISYDNYMFYNNQSSYFSNLVTIRTAAKNEGIPFWSILYSCKASGQPTPSPATLRFQLYTSLAYGAEGISWFLYFNDNANIWSLSPIDINGNKTNTWYYLKDVNLAMYEIGPIYLTLNNVGYYHGSSPSGWSISGSDLLVGDFDQIGTGQSFVLVVNKSMSSSRSYTVSESLPGGVYYVSPTDGQLYPLSGSLILNPGEGRLLTVQ